MTRNEKLKQFFEQLRGKAYPNAQDIRNAAAKTGNITEIAQDILIYAAAMGINATAELADLTQAHETAQQEKALKETAAILAEQSNALAVETDTEKQSTLIESIRRAAVSLGTTPHGKQRIYTASDYLNECLNYDPSKDFTPALFGGLAFPDGTTSYIGARTSRGKTTVMVNVAREALSTKQSRKTIFITLEMSGKQIMNKLILSTAFSMGIADNENNRKTLMGMNPSRDIYAVLKRGELPYLSGSNIFRHYVTEAHRAVSTAQEQGLFILYDGRGAGEPEIINFITSHGGKGVVILLDYIQKMPAKPGSDSDSFRKVQAISYDVVTAAAETNAVIIAGAQFNRLGGLDALGDQFDDQSFRESGDIEQDAHNAIGIGWMPDKQGRFYEVLKTREDKKQGTLFSLNFCGDYSYMDHGEQIFRPQGKASGTDRKKRDENSGASSRKSDGNDDREGWK